MLERTFCHLSGIGEVTERRLWDQGLTSWDELAAARSAGRWREELDISRQRLAAGDAAYFGNLLRPGDTWRLFPDFRDRVAYLDIETDGGPEQIVTAVAVFDGRTTRTYARGRNLDDFEADIADYPVIVTYNGRSFDVPVLRRNLGVRLPQAHIDLRCVLGSLGIKGGLKACEKRFGIDRGELDGVDGYFAVILWREFERTGNEAVLETLLAYNAADVIGLEALLVRALNESLLATPFAHLYSLPVPEPGDNPHQPDTAVLRRLAGRYLGGRPGGWR
jgi:uncharacterized protein YprB with RNaseH-like and TPR domain